MLNYPYDIINNKARRPNEPMGILGESVLHLHANFLIQEAVSLIFNYTFYCYKL